MTSKDPLERVGSFIEDVEKANTWPMVRDTLARHLRELGFDIFSYQKIGTPTGKVKSFYLSTYPREWIKRYNEKKYLAHDVRALGMERFTRPYLWNEIDPPHMTPEQRLPIHEGGEFGIKSGASIPVHGAGRAKAHLAIASSLPQEKFEKQFLANRHILHLITVYLHERLAALRYYDEPTAESVLTQRERDILSWTAHGKTSDEIASILGISANTVNKHVQNICRKLGVNNKIHAVATALSQRLILG